MITQTWVCDRCGKTAEVQLTRFSGQEARPTGWGWRQGANDTYWLLCDDCEQQYSTMEQAMNKASDKSLGEFMEKEEKPDIPVDKPDVTRETEPALGELDKAVDICVHMISLSETCSLCSEHYGDKKEEIRVG